MSTPPPLQWDFGRHGVLSAAGSLAVFAVLYLLLVATGLSLHESGERLTIAWPAAGLMLMALWLAPHRRWPALLAVQIGVEVLFGGFFVGHYRLLEYFP